MLDITIALGKREGGRELNGENIACLQIFDSIRTIWLVHRCPIRYYGLPYRSAWLHNWRETYSVGEDRFPFPTVMIFIDQDTQSGRLGCQGEKNGCLAT